MRLIENISNQVLSLADSRTPSPFLAMAIDRLCALAGTRDFLFPYGKLSSYLEVLTEKMAAWRAKTEQDAVVEDNLMAEYLDMAALQNDGICCDASPNIDDDLFSGYLPLPGLGSEDDAPIFVDPALLEEWGLLCGVKRRWRSMHPERKFSTFVSFTTEPDPSETLLHPFTPIFSSYEDPHFFGRDNDKWGRDPVTGLFPKKKPTAISSVLGHSHWEEHSTRTTRRSTQVVPDNEVYATAAFELSSYVPSNSPPPMPANGFEWASALLENSEYLEPIAQTTPVVTPDPIPQTADIPMKDVGAVADDMSAFLPPPILPRAQTPVVMNTPKILSTTTSTRSSTPDFNRELSGTPPPSRPQLVLRLRRKNPKARLSIVTPLSGSQKISDRMSLPTPTSPSPNRPSVTSTPFSFTDMPTKGYMPPTPVSPSPSGSFAHSDSGVLMAPPSDLISHVVVC
ncbi:hypothetical protein M427DRAFT_30788 [Gonapodya prolifera JEL478]|uniref:Uncharacterized protein n=1 Tax=Gonapodya prolifera (strain JEL478) TaxID=1344416 RepID=A0A139AJK4_GONPJ|nr:hypothetical protein M427DRAFT_30788 [Gonapodya prolifera JEL478]|eukprot:KXS16962.1 hypothetical protein M427DRAFT_30788 [Gonapodya prolifera JEL478]